MNLNIYMVEDFEVVEDGEIDHHSEFSHTTPHYQDEVIMGGDRIWRVTQVIEFYHLGFPVALDVNVAYVHPIGLEPKTMLQLTSEEIQNEIVPMTLEIALDNETKEFIQFSIGFESDPRPVGTRLFMPVQIADSARFEARPIDYWIRDNWSYAPTLPNRYERVHVSFCGRQPLPMPSVA